MMMLMMMVMEMAVTMTMVMLLIVMVIMTSRVAVVVGSLSCDLSFLLPPSARPPAPRPARSDGWTRANLLALMGMRAANRHQCRCPPPSRYPLPRFPLASHTRPLPTASNPKMP